MKEYIERDVVLDYAYCLRPAKSDYFNVGIAEEMCMDKEKEIADELENLPFVEIEDEQECGIWLHRPLKKYPDEHIFVCSNCDKTALAEYDYCPHCGLRMTKCLKN